MTEPGNLNQLVPRGQDWIPRDQADLRRQIRRIAGGVHGIAVVKHGDDGTVARPSVTLVMWVGAATPSNGVDYDFWYPATI